MGGVTRWMRGGGEAVPEGIVRLGGTSTHARARTWWAKRTGSRTWGTPAEQYFSVENRRFCEGAAVSGRDAGAEWNELGEWGVRFHRPWLPLDAIVGSVDQKFVLYVRHVTW